MKFRKPCLRNKQYKKWWSVKIIYAENEYNSRKMYVCMYVCIIIIIIKGFHHSHKQSPSGRLTRTNIQGAHDAQCAISNISTGTHNIPKTLWISQIPHWSIKATTEFIILKIFQLSYHDTYKITENMHILLPHFLPYNKDYRKLAI